MDCEACQLCNVCIEEAQILYHSSTTTKSSTKNEENYCYVLFSNKFLNSDHPNQLIGVETRMGINKNTRFYIVGNHRDRIWEFEVVNECGYVRWFETIIMQTTMIHVL
jgi:hypothetical protein